MLNEFNERLGVDLFIQDKHGDWGINTALVPFKCSLPDVVLQQIHNPKATEHDALTLLDYYLETLIHSNPPLGGPHSATFGVGLEKWYNIKYFYNKTGNIMVARLWPALAPGKRTRYLTYEYRATQEWKRINIHHRNIFDLVIEEGAGPINRIEYAEWDDHVCSLDFSRRMVRIPKNDVSCLGIVRREILQDNPEKLRVHCMYLSNTGEKHNTIYNFSISKDRTHIVMHREEGPEDWWGKDLGAADIYQNPFNKHIHDLCNPAKYIGSKVWVTEYVYIHQNGKWIPVNVGSSHPPKLYMEPEVYEEYELYLRTTV